MEGFLFVLKNEKNANHTCKNSMKLIKLNTQGT